jgi:cytochrome oxidase Cu insertion factor (SCO1/SenC/PrrC family)
MARAMGLRSIGRFGDAAVPGGPAHDAAPRRPEGPTLDRAAMLAAGPPPIPRRAVWLILIAAAVLGIGGAFADHSFDVEPSAIGAPPVHYSNAASRSLDAFVGLRSLGSSPAPAVGLADERGVAFSWKRLSGHPVILTFLGAGCADTCPVVSDELRMSAVDLQRRDVRPAVVIVNADPRRLPATGSAGFAAPAIAKALRDAIFLDGPLPALQRVWKAYGVTVELDPADGLLAYTSVVYLIDAGGHLRDSLTPFADESRTGDATLPAAQMARFASAIAGCIEQFTR